MEFPPLSYRVIWHSCSKLGQAHNRVVGGLQVGERLAQEVLQPGNIRQGEVVGRCERLSSSKSQAEEEEAPEQPCGHAADKKRLAYTSAQARRVLPYYNSNNSNGE